jgi:phenylacetic acid degradation operon negative regulatory protein
MTARSVLASALLGEDPPELPVAHLVHLAGLFGINGNRARVALSRMVAAGEVTTDGAGRYRLAGHLLARQHRQAASRSGDTLPWDGRWRVVVVTASGRSAEERGALRRRLALARLAEQREGVWLRPGNLVLRPDPADGDQVALFTATPDGDPVALAATLWDLDGWASGALGLLERLGAVTPATPDDLAPGFVLSAAVLRHLQSDPLLPAVLLPAGWPGTELRRRYDAWDRRYRSVLTRWGRAG